MIAAGRLAGGVDHALDNQAIRIDRIGQEGDGLATLPNGTSVYLPFTLPGETVDAGPLTKRGDGLTAKAAIIEPSADRVTPPCPHFGACGG